MNKQFLEFPKPEAGNEMEFNFETSFKIVIYLIDTKASPSGFVMNTELKLMSKTN
jgi:hypothetical protein